MLVSSPHRPAGQRGLSLVELMVGIAIGLFVVAGATMLTSTQLSENRRLLLDTQVQQDLRATADIVTRELRRAGFWQEAADFVSGATGGTENPLLALSPTGGSATAAAYRYFTPTARDGPFEFTLLATETESLIQFTVGGGPQDLTDKRTLEVTDFSVTPLHVSNAPAIRIVCEHACPDGSADCWPTIAVREFEVVISGESVSDPTVQRTIRSRVRVRNDAVEFNTGTVQVCPPPP